MNARCRFFALILTLAALPVQTSSAQAPDTLKDFTAVIILLGLPCGQVTSVQRQGKDDHIAVCENGARYRITVNAQGRVVADKQ